MARRLDPAAWITVANQRARTWKRGPFGAHVETEELAGHIIATMAGARGGLGPETIEHAAAIARGAAVDWFRSAIRNAPTVSLDADDGALAERLSDGSPPLHESIDAPDGLKAVMQSLTKDERLIVALHGLSGLTQTQTADVFGWSKQRMSAAIENVRLKVRRTFD